MIKSALSLHNKVLLPTLKAENPDPKLDIESSPFYMNHQPRPWIKSKNHPRRCGVSSFGFGGSNFHVVLEEHQPDKSEVAWDGSVEILAFSANEAKTLITDLERFEETLRPDFDAQTISRGARDLRKRFSTKDPFRLIVVVETLVSPDRIQGRIRSAREILSGGQPFMSAAKGVYYATKAETAGKIAFMFPGQGSQYVNMGRDLTCFFPEAMRAVETVADAFDQELSLGEFIFPRPASTDEDKHRQARAISSTDVAQPTIGAVSLAMESVLDYFGVRPHVTFGHSYGELPALCCAGWIDRVTLSTLSVKRGRLMADAGKDRDAGAMLAIKAPIDQIMRLADGLPDVVLANINGPEQGVLSGTTQGIESAKAACEKEGYKFVALPVAAAFHSPLVEAARAPFSKAVKDAAWTPASMPVFANVSAQPYPANAEQAADLLGRQLTSPVQFLDMVQNLYQTGVRTFVEVGPKAVLSGLVRSILQKQKDVSVIAVDRSAGKNSGILDLAHAIGHLAALGADLDICRWETRLPEMRKQKMAIPLSGANYRTPRKTNPNPPIQERLPVESKAPKPPTAIPSTPPMADAKRPTEQPMKNTTPQNMTTSTVIRQATPDPGATANLNEAMAIVNKGLESIQALQQQTAQAHQVFLETQAQAGRTLQEMMAGSRMLMGLPGGISQNPSTAHPIPEPVKFQPAAVPQAPKRPSPVSSRVIFSEKTSAPNERRADTLDKKPSPVAAVTVQTEKAPVTPAEPILPSHSDDDTQAIKATLIAIVADLTGYPEEMLEMDMDIEADLGIDSIKRVEILSAVEGKDAAPATGDAGKMVGTLKTGDGHGHRGGSRHRLHQADVEILSAVEMAEIRISASTPSSAWRSSPPWRPRCRTCHR